MIFPGGAEVKASACNVGDLGSIPGSGRYPWRRKWQPTPVFLPGESHRQRSLVGYSPQSQRVRHDFTFTAKKKKKVKDLELENLTVAKEYLIILERDLALKMSR